jgi:hypothetical protein
MGIDKSGGYPASSKSASKMKPIPASAIKGRAHVLETNGLPESYEPPSASLKGAETYNQPEPINRNELKALLHGIVDELINYIDSSVDMSNEPGSWRVAYSQQVTRTLYERIDSAILGRDNS